MVAAAVVGGAGVIVSDSIKDLPASKLPRGIQVVSAAQFAHDTTSVEPALALAAVKQISARYDNPPRSHQELLDVLATRYKMHDAVEFMRQADPPA